MPSSQQEHRIKTGLFYPMHATILENKLKRQKEKTKFKPSAEMYTWKSCIFIIFVYFTFLCLLNGIMMINPSPNHITQLLSPRNCKSYYGKMTCSIDWANTFYTSVSQRLCILSTLAYMAILLLLSGDIETNPGPQQHNQNYQQDCYTKIANQIQQGFALVIYEFSELKQKMNDYMMNMNLRNDSMRRQIDELDTNIDRLEDFVRKANVKFFGIEEDDVDGMPATDKLISLLNKYTSNQQWQHKDIAFTYREGPRKGKRSPPRPLVVSFKMAEDKIFILRDRKFRYNLGQMKIKIASDLTPKQQFELQHYRDMGLTAYYKNGELHVDNTALTERQNQPASQLDSNNNSKYSDNQELENQGNWNQTTEKEDTKIYDNDKRVSHWDIPQGICKIGDAQDPNHTRQIENREKNFKLPRFFDTQYDKLKETILRDDQNTLNYGAYLQKENHIAHKYNSQNEKDTRKQDYDQTEPKVLYVPENTCASRDENKDTRNNKWQYNDTQENRNTLKSSFKSNKTEEKQRTISERLKNLAYMDKTSEGNYVKSNDRKKEDNQQVPNRQIAEGSRKVNHIRKAITTKETEPNNKDKNERLIKEIPEFEQRIIFLKRDKQTKKEDKMTKENDKDSRPGTVVSKGQNHNMPQNIHKDQDKENAWNKQHHEKETARENEDLNKISERGNRNSYQRINGMEKDHKGTKYTHTFENEMGLDKDGRLPNDWNDLTSKRSEPQCDNLKHHKEIGIGIKNTGRTIIADHCKINEEIERKQEELDKLRGQYREMINQQKDPDLTDMIKEPLNKQKLEPKEIDTEYVLLVKENGNEYEDYLYKKSRKIGNTDQAEELEKISFYKEKYTEKKTDKAENSSNRNLAETQSHPKLLKQNLSNIQDEVDYIYGHTQTSPLHSTPEQTKKNRKNRQTEWKRKREEKYSQKRINYDKIAESRESISTSKDTTPIKSDILKKTSGSAHRHGGLFEIAAGKIQRKATKGL